MLKIKIVFLSIKLKLIKFFYKNYDPFHQEDNIYYLSPSYFLKDFAKEIHVSPDYYDKVKKKKLLRKLFNVSEKTVNLKVIKIEDYSLKKDYIRKKYFLKYSDYRDFPINIISKKTLKNPKAIIICLQGSNSGAHLNYEDVILPNDHLKVSLGSGHAIYAALNDCIGVSYERIGYGERREKNIKTKYKSTATFNIDPAFNFLLYGKTLLGESINELNSLILFLKKKYIDLPIYVMGYSDGGALAISLAAVNDDIDGITVSGCVGLFDDTTLKRTQTGLFNIPNLLKYFDMNDIIELIQPRFCLIIAGLRDHIWPYNLTKKVYDKICNNFKSEKNKLNLKLLKVEGGHKYYPKEMWEVLNLEINKNEKKN